MHDEMSPKGGLSMRKPIVSLCPIILLVLAVGVASSALIDYEAVFTASDFITVGGTAPAPADPINGSFSFSYEDSIIAPSGSDTLNLPVTEIALSIYGHNWTADDVGVYLTFYDGAFHQAWIGGLETGPAAMWGGGGDDFIVSYDYMGDWTMYYMIDEDQYEDIYWYASIVQGDLTMDVSVPDPSMVFLLGSACLIGFAGAKKKFKK
jgi:hypothetical protein